MSPGFAPLPASVDLPSIEQEILERWDKRDVFRRSLEQTAAGLAQDGSAYRRLFGQLVEHGTDVIDFFLTSALRRIPTRPASRLLLTAVRPA